MASGWSRARSSRAWTLLVMGVTAVVILAVSYLANRPAAGGGFTTVLLSGRATGPPPEIGKAAPDVTATAVDGERIKLGELRGNPVWVTFGATWCQPCRAENPDIQAAYERYRPQGLRILAIYIQDDASTIRDYAERGGLTFPIVDDADTRLASSYRIVGIPSHFFIDSSGILRVTKISSLDPSTIDESLSEIGVDVDRVAG